MSKKGNRRRHRVADMTIQPSLGPVFEPYREPAGDESREIYIGERLRIIYGVWFDSRHQLTDFVYTLQVAEDGAWCDVVRVDCCHQEAHIHRFDRDGGDDRRAIRPIVEQNDLTIAAERADDIVFNDFENSLRRWDRGR